MNIKTRQVVKDDVQGLKDIIDSSDLFPSALLDEMMENYFNDPASTDTWLTATYESRPIVAAYYAPEKLTDGTFNLYLIAVHKNFQGRGAGSEMMKCIEDLLRKKGERVLIVETSGSPAFALTRKFYTDLGYHREAVIREFYQRGEDKIVFWKKLN
ncbi:MAG: GNAT family N-acetyltransferase [Cytophagales bacterium]|nr:GNAT family N-acetyltransferase [Cytophagales bacterium]